MKSNTNQMCYSRLSSYSKIINKKKTYTYYVLFKSLFLENTTTSFLGDLYT